MDRHCDKCNLEVPRGTVLSTLCVDGAAHHLVDNVGGVYPAPTISDDNKFAEFSTEYNDMLGRGPSASKLRIFLRQENLEIARRLDEFLISDKLLFYLQGPPGVGKTKESLLWILQSVVKDSNTWAWIPLSKGGSTGSELVVYLLNRFDIDSKSVRYKQYHTENLTTDLRNWGVNVVVFDNGNQTNRAPIDNCVLKGFKTITVSSLQMKFDQSFSRHDAYTVSGWTEAEYREACNDDLFYTSVRAALLTEDFSDDELDAPTGEELDVPTGAPKGEEPDVLMGAPKGEELDVPTGAPKGEEPDVIMGAPTGGELGAPTSTPTGGEQDAPTGTPTGGELDTPTMRDDVVAAKYHLAGGSARWMFQYSTEQLLAPAGKVESIANHLDSVARDQIFSGFRGDRGVTEVNHLMSRIDKRVVIVSQYVANQLVLRHGEALLMQALSLLGGNPGMDGVLMEMDFILRLGRSERVKKASVDLVLEPGVDPVPVFQSGGNTTKFRLSTFATATFTATDGDWFIPDIFNNGGFDCVQYRLGKLIYVQVTRSHTHSFKLKWYQKFRSAFVKKFGNKQPINECEVWFIVQENLVGTFKPAAPTGKLTGYKKNSYRVAGLRRIKA